ncbi:ParB/RepB/Spo0J family partition protein [Aurantimonas sp. LRZ36]|uniref:ParB/RepB/Spo0J family partition protein n=2 Tax=Aurantimonas marianensis TaxID=2920428 RepID=A0A9X2H680_9HYPH|nr:ParB/RepB/Spo0J family partition protein [Aurantimonas marianensis]
MQLTHLNLHDLKPSSVNVRKKDGKAVGDLLPSIRSLGILQPLLVRPNCEGYEIIAGQRRYHALTVLAEDGAIDPVPCIVMDDGDDAKAIEASLAENIARLPMDEIDQYKAFATLAAKGETVADIATRFGVTERLVNQRLAIANIIDPILNAYRRDEIRPDTLRILTMATPRQQKAWWKLHKSEDNNAPLGRALKDWLFGGTHIPVGNALFDIADYTAPIISDLFGEDRYFSDSDLFWQLQSTAVAEAREAFKQDGWTDVVLMEVGNYWPSWDYRNVAKEDGGKVFITCTRDGEVTFHEGYLTAKEADRRDNQAETGDAKTERSELTKAMQTYLGLHRHAVVRTELLSHPDVALRLSVAHMIAGSGLWAVEAEPQRAPSEAIAESVTTAKANEAFAAERQAIWGMLGLGNGDDDDASDNTIVPRRQDYGSRRSPSDIFAALMELDDAAVMRVLTFVMAESLEAHTPMIEALGLQFNTDMRDWWTPDETFFDLLRDKEAINAMVAEVAGETTAKAYVTATAKVQKSIITACLGGIREAQIANWLPRYMLFPAQSYKPHAA